MPSTHPSPPAASFVRRAEALLERLRACSLAALDAPEFLDGPQLDRFVRERTGIMAALSPLTVHITALPAGDPLRASLAITMAAVLAVDARLMHAMDRRQQEIAATLLRTQQETRPAAYRPVATMGLALDLMR